MGPALPLPHPLTGKEVCGRGLQAGAGPPHLLHLQLFLPRFLVLIIQAPEEKAIKAHLGARQDEKWDGKAGQGRMNQRPGPSAWERQVRAQVEETVLKHVRPQPISQRGGRGKPTLLPTSTFPCTERGPDSRRPSLFCSLRVEGVQSMER